MKYRSIKFLLAAILMAGALFEPLSLAEGTEAARLITSNTTITAEGFIDTKSMTDGKEEAGAVCENGGSVQIEAYENIGSIYVAFNNNVTEWEVLSGEKNIVCGEYGFWHEYVDIKAQLGETSNITLKLPAGFDISELYVFSEGEKPAWVQVWQPPLDRADLLLYSTHSDDDQLYFAGLIPYYNALGYRVQVAFFTYHPHVFMRRHELLNGLWTAGEVNYPICSDFADFRVDDLQQTIAGYAERGVSYEDCERFVVETTRRVKPLVVVSHDPKGEYGHGMHQLLSQLVRESVDVCPNENLFPESAQKYGVWKVPKTYLHLYNENKLVLNIDTPMDYFGGKTPFQVSQQAFSEHKSQQYPRFVDWLYGTEEQKITKASQIEEYNPANYGLYASFVGLDTGKNDMFEHITAYEDQEALQAKIDEKDRELSQVEPKLEEAESKLNEANETIDSLKKLIIGVMCMVVLMMIGGGVCIIGLYRRMMQERERTEFLRQRERERG